MDGATLISRAGIPLDGVADGDTRKLCDCLDMAAGEFIRQSRWRLTDEVEVTTVADQQAYDLPPDFVGFYMRNRNGLYFAKYVNGTVTTWPVLRSYEDIFRLNRSARDTPASFAIRNKPDTEARITGTATADGAASGGECTLTASAASFVTDGVKPRDLIHNTADGSSGVVLEVADGTHLVVALFNGTSEAWASGDAYIILPGHREQLVMDSPSGEDGNTVTLAYLKKPAPVYSDYGRWPFPEQYCEGIVMEAAFRFQADYDEQAKNNNHLRGLFNQAVGEAKREVARRVLGQQRSRDWRAR